MLRPEPALCDLQDTIYAAFGLARPPPLPRAFEPINTEVKAYLCCFVASLIVTRRLLALLDPATVATPDPLTHASCADELAVAARMAAEGFAVLLDHNVPSLPYLQAPTSPPRHPAQPLCALGEQPMDVYARWTHYVGGDPTGPDDSSQDAVVAARELNLAGLAPNQRTWVNEHTIYTHGYGVVVARGNDRAADGSPSYLESNVPTTGEIELDQPRIYFGEGTTDYSIVGGRDNEIDYPDGSAGGFATTQYDGTGGVDVGNLFEKLVYALKFGDQNILLSSSVNRTPRSSTTARRASASRRSRRG